MYNPELLHHLYLSISPSGKTNGEDSEDASSETGVEGSVSGAVDFSR